MPGYKQTEVGVIPEEWDVKPLSAMPCDVIDCHHSTPVWTSDGVVVIRNQNIRDGKLVLTEPSYTDEEHYRDRIRRAKPSFGDLVITREAPMGQVCMIPSGLKCCLGQRMVLLRIPQQPVDRAFILYAIQAEPLQRYITVVGGTGSTVGNLRIPIIKSLPIPTPRPPEQRAIAAALSDMDALLGGLERLVAKKRDLEQAAMQKLLTGQTRLPGFCGEWEVKTVNDLERLSLVKLSRGQVISKKDINNSPGDFPIYSSSIHNDGLFGRYGQFMFDEELITWSVDGGGNFFHRRKHKFSVTNVCGFMRVDSARIDYRFLAAELQLLHSRKSFDYQSKAHPSVVRKEYEVRLPALREQIAIADVLSDMGTELSALEARRHKTRELKQAMMQELLTGRTRLMAAEAFSA